jgi:hypothetical protein
MQRPPSLLTVCAGLWLALFVGQQLHAATPLWELRAERKAKKAAKKAAPAPEAPRIVSELDRVMGKEARTLIQMFGEPAQDVREAAARKLQFATTDCVLDAYLYAPSEGKDAVVTYVTARVSDGRDAERNSCISALRLKR